MSRTFKKFDGEKEQREQYFRSEREASKCKKFQRVAMESTILDEDGDYSDFGGGSYESDCKREV